MAYYGGTQFPEKYRGGMFVAFHGSWNRAPLPQAGYKVAFVPFDEKGLPRGNYETFADGFSDFSDSPAPHNAHFRAGGLAVGPDGSLYVGDTEKGRLWRIIYTGEPAPTAGKRAVVAAPTQTLPTLGADTPGGKIYTQVCAACHMPNGSGATGMQPALIGSKVIAGDTTQLINVLLKGPAAVLPADREKFSNVMPPFGAAYSDADVASVINFIRANFAPAAPRVTTEQVAAQRSKP